MDRSVRPQLGRSGIRKSVIFHTLSRTLSLEPIVTRAEGKTTKLRLNLHGRSEKSFFSSALRRRENREVRPELVDVMTTTVWARDLSFFTIDESQDSRKSFLAGAAEELVVRHACLLLLQAPNR